MLDELEINISPTLQAVAKEAARSPETDMKYVARTMPITRKFILTEVTAIWKSFVGVQGRE